MKFAFSAALVFAALVGCSSGNVDSPEAVKQGVLRDISKNVNVGAMDVSVVSVRFRDKEADAVVAFSPKGGNAAQGLTMSYTLARQGRDWHIVKRAQSGHAAQQMPETAAPGTGTALPPGHPADTGGSPLPPGHPPMDGSAKP